MLFDVEPPDAKSEIKNNHFKLAFLPEDSVVFDSAGRVKYVSSLSISSGMFYYPDKYTIVTTKGFIIYR